jgi:hypothetical protein
MRQAARSGWCSLDQAKLRQDGFADASHIAAEVDVMDERLFRIA